MSFIQIPLLAVSFYHSSVKYCVHWNLVLLHTLKNLNRSLYIRVFYTSIKQTTISYTVRCQVQILHVLKHIECFVKLVRLAKSFDQNTKRD